MSVTRKPNFLYIGPNKAASTWIYEALRCHPEVYVPEAKDLHYFDIYYDKGPDWYFGHFKGATDAHKMVGDISHDYMYSEEACQRIGNDLGRVLMIVSLREPIDRAFSEYLYLIKQGYLRGTFEDAIEQVPSILDHSMYGKHLLRYRNAFGADALLLTDFGRLKTDAGGFYLSLCEGLGISQVLPESFPAGEVLSAAAPRSFLAARIAKSAAMFMRKQGWATQIKKVKSLGWLQNALYRPYEKGEKPVISLETTERLKDRFRPDVELLDREFSVDFGSKWGYASAEVRLNGRASTI
jgi:hypothetical protein